jgi:hypothetical protein
MSPTRTHHRRSDAASSPQIAAAFWACPEGSPKLVSVTRPSSGARKDGRGVAQSSLNSEFTPADTSIITPSRTPSRRLTAQYSSGKTSR